MIWEIWGTGASNEFVFGGVAPVEFNTDLMRVAQSNAFKPWYLLRVERLIGMVRGWDGEDCGQVRSSGGLSM